MSKNEVMTPEARAARASYMREWRRRNPEKTKRYEREKWERKAAAAEAQKGLQAENE